MVDTVQEKAITHPVDTKQYRKIISACWKLADEHGVRIRRRYRKEVRQCVMVQLFGRSPRQKKLTRRAKEGCA